MGWLNIFGRKVTIESFAAQIFKSSSASAAAFEELIQEKYGKETKESRLKLNTAVIEFAVFYLNAAYRMAFDISPAQRGKALDEIAAKVFKRAIQQFSADATEKAKAIMFDLYFQQLNEATKSYSLCKEFILPLDEDTSSFDKEHAGAVSKSMCGQLADRLSVGLFDERWRDPLFFTTLTTTVTTQMIELNLKKSLTSLLAAK